MNNKKIIKADAVKYALVLLTGLLLVLSGISLAKVHQLTEYNEVLAPLYLTGWAMLLLSILLTLILIWGLYLLKKLNQENQELEDLVAAIYLSQAIIEYTIDGNIVNANEKFLEVMNYNMDEIVGKHHSIFLESDYRSSPEYKEFWTKLKRGEFKQGEYKRIAKGGKEVWMQCTYTPILDKHGKPYKVMKIATDVTDRKNQERRLAEMTERLQGIGQQMLMDSSELSTGIEQLESTAISQASSASQQATSVNQISTTIEEIKTTTQQTLNKAKQLGESASKTTQEGERGRAAIDNMAQSMHVLQEKIQQISTTILSLNDKTQQISEITEAVSDIAKQSKMLALNASIEAAKAGESGKGFSVVADEVKELAEKSQVSTERVQKILQDIRRTAERAVMVTEEGTKSVEDNIQHVKSTGDIIISLGKVLEESSMASLHIVSAIREESIAMEQVDQGIKEINKVTSLFSSASEQTKQSIISLSRIANSLKETAEAYDTKQG